SFDSQGNSISVNNAFLDVCGCPASPGACVTPPVAMMGSIMKNFSCMSGSNGVQGTDWAADSTTGWTNGSTGWLQTSAPVQKGATYTLRFVTYDSGDPDVDSSTFVDNFQWSAEPGTVVTVKPPPK